MFDMKKVLVLLCIVAVFSYGRVLAQESNIEAIDTPTANSIDLGSYAFSVRLYEGGSILTRLYYGIIMEDLTLGLSFDTENLVGTESVSIRRPFLYIKLPLYSGDQKWPAISMGFDEQGLGRYDDDINEYEIPPMGFFFVFTKLGIYPGLNFSAGMNANYSLVRDAEEKIMGFCSADFMIGPEFMLLAEVKEIQPWNSYVNAGAKYFLTPELNFEFSALDLNQRRGDMERIIRIVYTKVWGSF
jgi:hypothetical protein